MKSSEACESFSFLDFSEIGKKDSILRIVNNQLESDKFCNYKNYLKWINSLITNSKYGIEFKKDDGLSYKLNLKKTKRLSGGVIQIKK